MKTSRSSSHSEFFAAFRPLVISRVSALVRVVPDAGGYPVLLRLSSGALVEIRCERRAPRDALRDISCSGHLEMEYTEVEPSDALPLMCDVSWCAWLLTEGHIIPPVLPEPNDAPYLAFPPLPAKAAAGE